MDKRLDLFKILEQQDKLTKVIIYPAVETIADPYENNKTLSYLNPITIKAYVATIKPESLRWKYVGQLPSESVEILCEIKYDNLLRIADKTQIGDNYYKCYKDDAQGFSIVKRENYIMVVLERKNT